MSKAITQMHKAISLLDGRSTELVKKLFPEMVAVAQLYADIFPDCKSWKEDIIQPKGERSKIYIDKTWRDKEWKHLFFRSTED